MRQNDYNQQQPGLVAPGSMPQGVNGFQQPVMAIPGGNYAPNPYPYQNMGATFGGPGYAQGNFPQNGWNNPGHNDPNSIRDVMSESEAEAAVARYDTMINQLNGIDPELAEVKANGVTVNNSVDATYHELLRVIKLLEFPEEWIPPHRAKYIELVREGPKSWLPKLKHYTKEIAKLR